MEGFRSTFVRMVREYELILRIEAFGTFRHFFFILFCSHSCFPPLYHSHSPLLLLSLYSKVDDDGESYLFFNCYLAKSLLFNR